MANVLTVRLVCGGETLNLNDGTNYSVETDFVPPVTRYDLLTTAGTSTNRYNGESVYDKRAQNREWSFGIRLEGQTAGQNRLLFGRLRAMLNCASGKTPLFIETKAGADIPDPVYGQSGSPLRYEVVRGEVGYTDLYGSKVIRDEKVYPNNTIRLQIKPFALGVETELGKAEGTIYYYPIGNRPALGVSQAATNLFTNPIFGSTTPASNWSTPTGGVISYDVALFGGDNNKVAYKAYTGQLTQSLTLTANPHTLSCYARKPDETAVTSSDVQLYYNGSTVTTAYEDVGQGWYRLTGTITGTAGAAATGVDFSSTCVVDGFQVQTEEIATPLVHGDMVGASWSGTAHASTSTATASIVRFPADIQRRDAGTIRAVIRPTWGATDKDPGDYRVWDLDSLELVYDATNDVFDFTDSTNTATSSVQSFSAGDILVLHATYGPGGLALYVEGVADGSNGTYTQGTFDDDVYVGSSTSGASHIDAWFLDFAIFDTVLDATQIAADYADINNATQDGEALSSIPLIWTNDGDSVLDNCLSSGDSDWHYAWITGIPGDAPAVTKFLADVTGSGELIMSLMDCDDHFNPDGFTFVDESGTVDASRCGGEYLAAIDDKLQDVALTAISAGNRALLQYAGRTIHAVMVLAMFDSMGLYTTMAGIRSPRGEYGSGSSGSFDVTIGGGVVAPPRDILTRPEDEYSFVPDVESDQFSGPSTYFNVDFQSYFVEPILHIIDADSALGRVAFNSLNNTANQMSSDTVTGQLETQGGPLEFVPHRWNLLQVLGRDFSTRLHDITDTTTLTEVSIIPRYEVAL